LIKQTGTYNIVQRINNNIIKKTGTYNIVKHINNNMIKNTSKNYMKYPK